MKNLGNFTFSFNFITHDDTVKELNKLESKKASQKTDIPINNNKIIIIIPFQRNMILEEMILIKILILIRMP